MYAGCQTARIWAESLGIREAALDRDPMCGSAPPRMLVAQHPPCGNFRAGERAIGVFVNEFSSLQAGYALAGFERWLDRVIVAGAPRLVTQYAPSSPAKVKAVSRTLICKLLLNRRRTRAWGYKGVTAAAEHQRSLLVLSNDLRAPVSPRSISLRSGSARSSRTRKSRLPAAR